jgi:hypothetical protein
LYQNNSTPNSDGHYYTTISCEEFSKITGENECQDNNGTPSYQAPYTTPPETPSNTTPTTPTYNVPDYIPAPTPAKTCSNYHAEYYAEYQNQLHSTNTHYTNAINNAAASCKSFGGCPQKTSLEQQWVSDVAQLKNSYRTNMSNVGCNPSEFVDF